MGDNPPPQPPPPTSQWEPKPSVGRIVHYHFPDNAQSAANNGQAIAPAIITAVWSDSCVNLKVLHDEQFNTWKTAVMKGTGPHNWNWPQKV